MLIVMKQHVNQPKCVAQLYFFYSFLEDNVSLWHRGILRIWLYRQILNNSLLVLCFMRFVDNKKNMSQALAFNTTEQLVIEVFVLHIKYKEVLRNSNTVCSFEHMFEHLVFDK